MASPLPTRRSATRQRSIEGRLSTSTRVSYAIHHRASALPRCPRRSRGPCAELQEARRFESYPVQRERHRELRELPVRQLQDLRRVAEPDPTRWRRKHRDQRLEPRHVPYPLGQRCARWRGQAREELHVVRDELLQVLHRRQGRPLRRPVEGVRCGRAGEGRRDRGEGHVQGAGKGAGAGPGQGGGAGE